MAGSSNTVELVIKVAADQAKAAFADLSGSLNTFTQHVTGLDFGRLSTLGLVAGGAYEAFKVLVSSSAELHDAVFRLDNVFQAFSKTVGQTRSDLVEFQNTAQQGSRFDNVDIINAQQTLLKFGTITGETFKKAEQASLDLGAQLGDLGQAAYIVGRALAAPEQSSRLLREAGVVLTDQQKEQIKAFEEVGNKAGSANIILGELEKRYGGAALRDLQTYTGAWDHLKNTFHDIFENTGISSGMAKVFNAVDRGLRDILLLDQIAAQEVKEQAEKDLEDAKNAKVDLAHVRGGRGLAETTPLSAAQQITKNNADLAYSMAQLAQSMQLVEQNGQDLEKMKTDDESSTKAAGQAYMEAAAEVRKFKEAQQELLISITDQDFSKEIADSTAEAYAGMSSGFVKELDQMEQDAERVHKNLITNIQDVFANFFTNTKGGFRGLVESFGQMLVQMAAQAAAANLTKGLFGGAFGTFLSGLFGGSPGGGPAGQGLTEFGPGDLSALTPHAAGGSGSGLALVGEEGPEVVATGQARFMNARQLAAAGGGGGHTIEFKPVTNIVMQPKDGDVNSLRSEFYAAIDLNNKKLKNDIYYTMNRNGLGRMR